MILPTSWEKDTIQYLRDNWLFNRLHIGKKNEKRNSKGYEHDERKAPADKTGDIRREQAYAGALPHA